MNIMNYKPKLSEDLENKFAGYQFPSDAVTMLGTPSRIASVLTFMLHSLREYAVRYRNGEIGMMPIITYEDAKAGTQYLVFEHNFFIQTLAQYSEYFFPGTGQLLADDFCINPEQKTNKANALFLNYSYLQNVVGVAFINSASSKLSVPYLRFGTQSIFKNDRAAVEFTALNFNVSRLEKIIGEEIVDELLKFGFMSDAKQVAFGKEASTYFVDNKLKKKYFMTSEHITVYANFL